MLELRHVVKTYTSGDDRVCAANGISLTVKPGEFVAVFGPSGSGKTTLLHLAAGITRPDEGEILFEGTDVAQMSRRQADDYRLRQLGIVFQSHHLLPGAAALDNAAFKLLGEGSARGAARRRVAPWLDRVGLARQAKRRPAKLSMGERQRVSIARALSNDPKLVLADEPTGSLDSESGRNVLALLDTIARERGVAVVLVTHDSMALDFADRVFDLRDGNLTERSDGEAVRPVAAEGG
jgi:putative ABC transport system ATP-binding protein